MLSALVLAITLTQKQPTPLPQRDWVDIYAAGYRFLAKKVTFKPKGVYLFGLPQDQPELERKVRARLSEMPTVAYDAYMPERHLMLYLDVPDVLDRNHARFVGSFKQNDLVGGVMVRTGKTWKVAQPAVSAKERNEIQRISMLYVLQKADRPYSAKERNYVGLIQTGGKASIGYNEAVDPSPEMMQMLWRLGYHVKPVSEHPYSRDGYSPPRAEFGVGDIQPIDGKRAVVFIVRNDWNKEPGYNSDYGPNAASFNYLLVVKQNGKWLPKELRSYWQPDPAE